MRSATRKMDATHIGFERDKYMTQLVATHRCRRVGRTEYHCSRFSEQEQTVTFTFHRHFSTHRVVTLQMLEEEAFSGEDPDCGLR